METYSTDNIKVGLNKYMYDQKYQLRIEKVFQLDDTNFDCRRWATMREYVYKIIIVEPDQYDRV